MNNTEYQTHELKLFRAQKHSYFDTVKDFAEHLEDMDIPEQIEWIANGSYGAGPCLALQAAVRSITPRSNGPARIGSVILHAFYGKPFTAWNRLPEPVRARFQAACEAFLAAPQEYAMTLE